MRDLVLSVNEKLRKLRDASGSEKAVTHEHFMILLNAVIKLTNVEGEYDEDEVEPEEKFNNDIPVESKPIDRKKCAHDISIFDGRCKRCGESFAEKKPDASK